MTLELNVDHLPFDAVLFDCDGTLSAIEGIDVLAAERGVGEAVAMLTQQAMSTTGVNASLYQKRLMLAQPTRQQVEKLAQTYFEHRVADAKEVVALFNSLNKPIYVLSAGVNPAVRLFAGYLGIPAEAVFAVDLFFDQDGQYQGYDHEADCAKSQGKRRIAEKLKQKHPRLVHVGDGMNDVEVSAAVDCFIGFGGFFLRENIRALSDYYIACPSLAAVLPLILTVKEQAALLPSFQEIYKKALSWFERGCVSKKEAWPLGLQNACEG